MSLTLLTLGAQSDRGDVLLWVGVLIGLVLAGTVAVVLLRRSILRPDGGSDDEQMGLGQLRVMRDTGQISPEEYEAMRARMVGRAKDAASTLDPATRDALEKLRASAKRGSSN